MKKEEWQKVKEIFAVAVEQPAAMRSEFLREACGENDFLRREVESLLEASAETEQIIEKNAFDLAGRFQQANTFEGKQFGNYKILREIGRGGMGAVFLAARTDAQFDQQVALKIIRQALAHEEIERHFRRERQILASLNHPNIARLNDGGVSDDGLPYFVMEYIEGEPLLEFAENRRLDINERLDLFLKICSAVAYAHRHLVIHRDIKPSNILVDAEGTPKLLDFGLAKTLDFELDSNKTETVFRAFTPAYASPEQMRGQNVTTASDVYSLGVCLYELLTTRRPYEFKTESVEEIIHAVCDTDPIRPSQAITKRKDADTRNEANPQIAIRNPQSLKGDLDNIILKALRKEPERRYATVEQFAADIERYLKGLPVSARPATVTYRAAKFIERNKLLVAAAVLIVLSLVAGLAVSLWQANVARKERDRAERRFGDVRQLSNALLTDIAPKIERIQGTTEAREVLVTQSLKYLDSLARESADDLSLQSELASAYEKVGDLQGATRKANLSDFKGAIESYEKAQIIRRALVAAKPQEMETKSALAANLAELSSIRWWFNDVEGALSDLEKALAIYEELIAARPDNLVFRLKHSEAKLDIAYIYAYNQRYSDAYPHLRPTLALLENLRVQNPNNSEIRRLLGKGLTQLGIALSWDGKQKEGEGEMAKAIAFGENLFAENPGDAIIRNNLWTTYMQTSSVYEEVDDKLSEEYASKALKLAAEIAERDSSDTQAKQNLAKSYSRLGVVLINLKKIEQAVSYLQKSLAILTVLRQSDSRNAAYKADLARIYTRLGGAEQQRRGFQESLSFWEKAAAIYSEIGADANQPIGQRDLALACYNIAQINEELARKSAGEIRQKHSETAQSSYRRALDLLLELQARNSFAEFDREMLEEIQAKVQK